MNTQNDQMKGNNVMTGESICIEQNPSMRLVTRRKFIGVAALSGAGVVSFGAHGRFARSAEEPASHGPSSEPMATPNGGRMEEEFKNEKIRRATLAGPSIITSDATVAEMDRQGNMTMLRPGTNDWVCIPGDQNVIGQPDMALDPMGMVWLKDILARKPKPTNTSP
jgi:hypothetical protein